MIRAVTTAEGTTLDRVLDAACRTSRGVLSRRAYGKFHAARMKTSWGSRHQQRFALVEGSDILASAERYDLSGVFDGRPVRVCGIGSVFTEPSQRGHGHACRLVDALLDDAEREEAEVALLFPPIDIDDDVHRGFQPMPLTDLSIGVTESSRHGAPMTTVRGGEERDLAAIVAMGQSTRRTIPLPPRSGHRLRSVRHHDQTIARRPRAGARAQTAVLHCRGRHYRRGLRRRSALSADLWTLEECGDRDASGARVGALLQALIAREPAEQRPTIRAWLPPRFLPPQLTIASAAPSTDTVWVRALGSRTMVPPLSADDVLYWRNDIL